MAKKKNENREPASSFADSTSQLEDIIEVLENEETSLEDAMKAFENGIRITREVQKMLQQAEQKVALLLEDDGELIVEDFDGAAGSE
ncbi:exodeoxyribonuclease VII small subunit [Halioglobus sp.]|jgi:exodeoxyribonuclease VII small subunit|nr:exodeoxyribonuclease VII small subunit [Halioglobus sp.]